MHTIITTVPRLFALVGSVGAAIVSGILLLGSGADTALTAAHASDAVKPGPMRLAQAAPVPAPQGGAGPFTAEQKAAIEKIVKEYFLANPEVFYDIQQALEAKMEKIQAERMKMALKDNAKDIFKRANAPVAGNAQGDVTVVEFFDYNCGFCKRAFGDIAKLIEKDPKIKLVLKELPILSKGSEDASKVALAAKLQGKYWEAHRALLTVRGELNEQTALRTVEKLGLDMAKLRKDMESPEVLGEIRLVRELAQKMGIQGTPHFLIGDRAIPGAPGNLLEQVQGHVAELRKTGCSVC
jgi:protein-disulfide isomerase